MSGRFRKALPRLSREEQIRQGRVVKSAQAALVDTNAIRTFLNTHHEGLCGRPLDVATASDAGHHAEDAANAQMRTSVPISL
jgi:hypothetical protein